MGRMGVLSEHDRVELLEGEVVVMSPIGNRHAACVSRLTDAMYASGGLGRRALVRVQNPLAEPAGRTRWPNPIFPSRSPT